MIASLSKLIVALTFLILVATDDVDFENRWWTALCEQSDEALFKEIGDCFSLTDAELQAGTFSCMERTSPGNGRNVGIFVKAVCGDRSLADKLNECIIESPTLAQKWHEDNIQYEECLKSVLAKYEVQIDWAEK